MGLELYAGTTLKESSTANVTSLLGEYLDAATFAVTCGQDEFAASVFTVSFVVGSFDVAPGF